MKRNVPNKVSAKVFEYLSIGGGKLGDEIFKKDEPLLSVVDVRNGVQ